MTKKIGAGEEGNKRPSCKDRQNQPLIELYDCSLSSAPVLLPTACKISLVLRLNSVHLANNIQIEIGRKTKGKFILTHSSFQAPTFLWRIVIFNEKEKLFSIMKDGFPFLPLISVQLHPTEVSLMEPQTGRQMSLCRLICAYFFTEL